MTSLMPALAGNTWAAIAIALGAFLVLLGGLQVYARATGARPETTRKMFHTGSGVLTLAFPFLFRQTWPVLALTGTSALLVAGIKFLPALRDRLEQHGTRVIYTRYSGAVTIRYGRTGWESRTMDGTRFSSEDVGR